MKYDLSEPLTDSEKRQLAETIRGWEEAEKYKRLSQSDIPGFTLDVERHLNRILDEMGYTAP